MKRVTNSPVSRIGRANVQWHSAAHNSSSTASTNSSTHQLLGQPSPTTHPHLFDMRRFDRRLVREMHKLGLTSTLHDTAPTQHAFGNARQQGETSDCQVEDQTHEFATPGVPKAEYQRRRDTLLSLLPKGSIMILPSAMQQQRRHDILHPFHQESHLQYLTGCREDDVLLVLSRGWGDDSTVEDKVVLFCKEQDAKEAMWHGPRSTPVHMQQLLGIPCETISPSVVVDYLKTEVKRLTLAMTNEEHHTETQPPPEGTRKTRVAFSPLPRLYMDAPSFTRYQGGVVDPSTNHWFASITHLVAKTLVDHCGVDKYGYALPVRLNMQLSGDLAPPKENSPGLRPVGNPKHSTQRIIKSSAPLLWQARSVKTPTDARMFIRSAEITACAFATAMKHGYRRCMDDPEGYDDVLTETDLFNEMDYCSRRLGAEGGMGYIPVVASGSKSLTLHYIQNNATINKNSFMMVDAGCEFEGIYPTDCTRAWPVGGQFSHGHRELYEGLLDVQVRLIKQCRVGTNATEMHLLTRKLLWEMLQQLGIAGTSATQPNSDKRLIDLFFPHNWGHFTGFDIHETHSHSQLFVAGTMHTVEPGVYIPDLPTCKLSQARHNSRYGLTNYVDSTKKEKRQPVLDVQAIPQRFRGIGLRIEDQILILPPKGTPERNAFLEQVFRSSALHDATFVTTRNMDQYIIEDALVTTAAMPKTVQLVQQLCQDSHTSRS